MGTMMSRERRRREIEEDELTVRRIVDSYGARRPHVEGGFATGASHLRDMRDRKRDMDGGDAPTALEEDEARTVPDDAGLQEDEGLTTGHRQRQRMILKQLRDRQAREAEGKRSEDEAFKEQFEKKKAKLLAEWGDDEDDGDDFDFEF